MTKINQLLEIKRTARLRQEQKQYQILRLDHPSDDDLSKFYYLESQSVKGKWYRLVASAFGALSCSCQDQTRNPYKSCKHMRNLDEIIDKSPDKIQKTMKVPSFILDSFKE